MYTSLFTKWEQISVAKKSERDTFPSSAPVGPTGGASWVKPEPEAEVPVYFDGPGRSTDSGRPNGLG